MARRLKQIVAVLIVLFAAAQLLRPGRTNPPIEAARSIQTHLGTNAVAVLDRACGDCHSNQTRWPWYTQIAPLSWLMARGVAEGRKAVNFSEWAEYSPAQRQSLLSVSCEDAKTGRMPDRLWTTLHPETRLSAPDIETICAEARRSEHAVEGASR